MDVNALNWGGWVKTDVGIHKHTNNTYIYRFFQTYRYSFTYIDFIIWHIMNEPRFECNKHADRKFSSSANT